MVLKVVDNEDGTFDISSGFTNEVEYVDLKENLVKIDSPSVTQTGPDTFEISTIEIEGAKLEWSIPGERRYESGLDKGVLYLPDGSAIPWNGLTSVVEKIEKEVTPIYYDGAKINNGVILGSFSATMRAVTYPDEFAEVEGLSEVRTGVFFADQKPKSFGLCYRTMIGNDLDGESVDYKIHIVYNLIAKPADRTYATHSVDPSLVEFEWDIEAVPENIPGFRPTAQIIVDSRDIDPWLLEELETMLYGSDDTVATLIPMSRLTSYIVDWYRIKIVDHGDGTWSAVSQREGLINFGPEEDFFEILMANVIYIDEDTFILTDTKDIHEIPQIRITVFPDGRWNASASHAALIEINSEGMFEIKNANVIWVDEDTYQLSDTVE